MSSSNRRPQQFLNAAAATLAAGVAIDSTTEHYRAGFHNRAMFVAPVVATFVLVASARAAVRARPVGRPGSAVFTTSILAGLGGLGFHLRNTSRRVGGWTSSSNVFHGAPVAAPLAVTMAGALGLLASREAIDRRSAHRVGTVVAALATGGLVGTAAEAGSLHFRGAFQNRVMYVPVVIPPITAATLASATLSPSPARRRLAATLLSVTASIGLAGTYFHARGVQRRMGGWRNWRQNLFAGPPLPAPPAFTGLSLAGLAALQLLDARDAR